MFQGTAGHHSYTGLGLNVLSDFDLEEIHQASLEVLESTGVRFEDEEALSLFAAAGANVDHSSQIVRIPGYMAEHAIRITPSSFLRGARNEKNSFVFGGNHISLSPFGTGYCTIDLETGEYRRSTLRDLEDTAKIVDAQDSYSVCTTAVFPHDVSQKTALLHAYRAQVANTSKPCGHYSSGKVISEYLIEMAAAVAGGEKELRDRSLVRAESFPASPLVFHADDIQNIITYASFGLPTCVDPYVIASSTGPATIAGTIVIQNAEILAGLVLNHIVREGNPFEYASCSSALNLRQNNFSINSIDHTICSIISAKLAHWYKIPCSVSGGDTNSSSIDFCSGLEKGFNMILPMMAGANIIFGGGNLNNCNILDFGQLIIDNEIFLIGSQLMEGILVNNETIPRELIHEIGIGGSYLVTEHTINTLRSQRNPLRITNQMDPTYKTKGEDITAQKAKYIAKEILKNHKPLPLQNKVLNEFQRIIDRAENDPRLDGYRHE